jgi:hypothetical protein
MGCIVIGQDVSLPRYSSTLQVTSRDGNGPDDGVFIKVVPSSRSRYTGRAHASSVCHWSLIISAYRLDLALLIYSLRSAGQGYL